MRRRKDSKSDRKGPTVPPWFVRLSHLWLIERKGSPPEVHEVRPTAEQLFHLIDLAVQAGGIDALRAWLDDVERLVKPKRGQHGGKYQDADSLLIWGAYELSRIDNVSKHKAIGRVVDRFFKANERWPGQSRNAAVTRLMSRPWPPVVGAGISSPLQRASKLSD
jgi:hypothetical protein